MTKDLTSDAACEWLNERYGTSTTDEWEELLLDPIALTRDLLLAAEAMQENAKLREALEDCADHLALLAKDPGPNPWVQQAKAALAICHHAGSE